MEQGSSLSTKLGTNQPTVPPNTLISYLVRVVVVYGWVLFFAYLCGCSHECATSSCRHAQSSFHEETRWTPIGIGKVLK